MKMDTIEELYHEFICKNITFNSKLDASEKQVLSVLCQYSMEEYEEGEGACTPAIISIAKKSGFGRTKTKEVLDRLIEKNYITKNRRKVKGKKENDTNLYTILGLKKLFLGAKRRKIEKQMKKDRIEQQELEKLKVEPHEVLEMEELLEFAKANNCSLSRAKAMQLLRMHGIEFVECAIIRASMYCKKYIPFGYLQKTIKSALPLFEEFIDLMAFNDGSEEWKGFGLQTFMENRGFLRYT